MGHDDTFLKDDFIMKSWKLHIIIPEIPPTNNQLLRLHWRDRSRLNKTWYWLIKESLMNNDFDPKSIKFEDKRTVKIVVYRKQISDIDNLYGGIKPVVDSLVKNDLLIDDGPKYCNLISEVCVDLNNQRTEIFIE